MGVSGRKLTESDVNEILYLRSAGLGIREIARRLGIARRTVQKYLRQVEALEK